MRKGKLVSAALALMLVAVACAPTPTMDTVKAQYGGWTAATAVANAYVADPFCVDGRVAGEPELGTMGFHYMKHALMDNVVDAMNPESVLVFGDKVVGVEYFVPDVGQPLPSIFGEKFNGPMEGHGPDQPKHYDLHMWFIDNPSGHFAEFNPALAKCPEGTLPPPPPAR